MLNFFKTTVLGGMIFLVPIVIFLAILAEGLNLTLQIAEPLASILPFEAIGGLAVAQALALCLLIVLCFVAGLAARTRLARLWVQRLEDNVLAHVPAYALMKAKAGSILTPEDTRDMTPVLIRFDDSWQVAFEVEPVSADKSLVFLPGAPDPWSGAVCAVENERITKLDVNMKTAADLMKRLGKGSTATLRAGFGGD